MRSIKVLFALLSAAKKDFEQLNLPQQVHVALTADDANGQSGVAVSWVTTLATPTSTVMYGNDPENLVFSVQAQAQCKQYKFCDYTSPCLHNVAIQQDFEPGQTLYYKCGDDGNGWSSVRSVKTPLPVGTDAPMRLGLMGDLGQTQVSRQTLVHLTEERNLEYIVLAGDLSYADSDQERWDSWGVLVDPLASSVPMMMAAGNHEMENPCEDGIDPFVAYQKRFLMPAPPTSSTLGQGNLYYAFRTGLVHFISITPYADFGPKSAQYRWLQQELEQRVDRNKTPWLCVVMHGPWYSSNKAHHAQAEPHFQMKHDMEELLFKHKVDFVMAGHVHAYERSLPVYKDEVRDDGIVHVLIGDAGNREGLAEDYYEPAPEWSAFRKAAYGYAILDVKNCTHAHFEWYEEHDQQVTVGDSTWLLSKATL